MIIGTKIEGHKELSKKHDIVVYNKPKYIYIPLIVFNSTDVIIEVKIDEYVFKGQRVAHLKGDLLTPIHSSVSGKVISFEDKIVFNGNKVKCIKIENDFKETLKENVKEIEKIDGYTKEEFVKLLKDSGIRGLGGADFPTYIKYDVNKKVKNLIINAVECEPYITADYCLLKQHYEEVIECCDAIMTINKIDNCYIGIKKYNTDIIKLLNSVIGTYPNIKIVEVPDLYPFGWEKHLIKYILKKECVGRPIELDTIVNNVSTIYAIYTLLKTHRPITDRIVTITGEMIKKPTNINVKIGTNLKDVLEDLGHKKGNILLVAGGPMMGVNIPEEELIVTPNLNSVLVLKYPEESIERECLRCGKCTSVCPVKLSPVLIKDAKDNVELLEQLQTSKCIECGLCSYICPAKILVREHVRQAKENMRRK